MHTKCLEQRNQVHDANQMKEKEAKETKQKMEE